MLASNTFLFSFGTYSILQRYFWRFLPLSFRLNYDEFVSSFTEFASAIFTSSTQNLQPMPSRQKNVSFPERSSWVLPKYKHIVPTETLDCTSMLRPLSRPGLCGVIAYPDPNRLAAECLGTRLRLGESRSQEANNLHSHHETYLTRNPWKLLFN